MGASNNYDLRSKVDFTYVAHVAKGEEQGPLPHAVVSQKRPPLADGTAQGGLFNDRLFGFYEASKFKQGTNGDEQCREVVRDHDKNLSGIEDRQERD